MKKLKQNLFSTPPNVLKKSTVVTLCMVMVGLFLVVGCKKDKPTVSETEPEYPIEIPFTEYSLLETTCQWVNFDYDNKVIVINSDKELANYISCAESNYPEIDFSKNSLLLASGETGGMPNITKSIQQLSLNEYELNVEILLDGTYMLRQWTVVLIVEKVSEESHVKLNVTETITPLQSTKWKLAGMVDAETGVLTEIDTEDGETSYTLVFATNSALYGHYSDTLIWGKYEVDYTTNNIHISVRNCLNQNSYYIESLNNVQSFSIQENQLRLYSNENNYLLFNLFDDDILKGTKWELIAKGYHDCFNNDSVVLIPVENSGHYLEFFPNGKMKGLIWGNGCPYMIDDLFLYQNYTDEENTFIDKYEIDKDTLTFDCIYGNITMNINPILINVFQRLKE